MNDHIARPVSTSAVEAPRISLVIDCGRMPRRKKDRKGRRHMPHGWTDPRYAMQPPPWAKPYSYDAFQQSDSSSSSSDSGSESEDKKSKMLGLYSGVLGFGGIGRGDLELDWIRS